MTKKIEIQFIDKGFRDVMLSQGAQDKISYEAELIKNKAGQGFTTDVIKGYFGTRWIAFVHSDTREAAQAEAENKVLSKAVQS